jgi:hypothetical protein
LLKHYISATVALLARVAKEVGDELRPEAGRPVRDRAEPQG